MERRENNSQGDKLHDVWGIKVERIMLTAAGNMIDFRYRVLDAEKAAPLFDPKLHPYIIDQKTGTKMGIPSPPKAGQLRNTTPPDNDRIYFIIFGNPGHFIKKGNRVDVVIGDLIIKDLALE